jgi:hypothetical protein
MARTQKQIHRVRLDPVPEPAIDEEPEDAEAPITGCVPSIIGCLAVLAGLGSFVTGITALVMAFRHPGSEVGLYLIAAALAFGTLVYTLFHGF